MPDDDPTRHGDSDDSPTIRGLRAGQVLFGRYVLESELGAGGMGVVWRARDAELDEPVALKFLPEVVARDDAAVDELKDETRHARHLTHPNIVRIHQFEREGAIAAVSMELVEGVTLTKLRLEQPGKIFAVESLAPLVAQLCAALDYAHGQAKIVHRDIKPANILVTRDNVVKVTDFGIARSLLENSARLTGTVGGASGTILYMSPQQVRGRKPKETDDLYSLGAMLYELLTGKPPFFRGDLYSMRMQILKNTPLPLAVQRAELEIVGGPIPQAWSATILACLAKEPEGRPQSAGEVAQRLGIKRAGSEWQRPAGPAGPSGLRRGRRIVLLAAATALGLGILATVFWHRPPEGPSASAEIGRVDLKTQSEPPASATLPALPAAAPARPGEFVVTIDPADASARLSLGPLSNLEVTNGRAVLKDLPDGEQELSVQAPGYQRYTTRVTVKGGRGNVEARLMPMRGAEEGRTWTVPELNMEMPYIFPGTFTMGSESGASDEKPLTRVTLTRGCWMGKTEVTQSQWQALTGKNPSTFPGADRPVEQVSWDEAMEFCHILTERERSEGRLPEGCVYTLPTEAQWEDVCRAGTAGDYAGDLGGMAWFGGSRSETTHAVAQKQPNGWGFFDMHGNVSEWCRDWYAGYPGGSVTDPMGAPSGSARVIRGGSWSDAPQTCRSASRHWSQPGFRSSGVGFRVALEPKTMMPEMQQPGREGTNAMHEETIAPRTSVRTAPSAPVSEAARKVVSSVYPDVQARYDHARELAQKGSNPEALAEFLWCFDDGMRKSPQFGGIRLGPLLDSVVKIGRQYPPALQALRDRRDAARAHLLAESSDTSAMLDLTSLNRELGESSASIAFYDQLPVNSRARAIFGRLIFEQLIEAKRYQEAVASQPYEQFKKLLDQILARSSAQPERKADTSRYVVQFGGKELEALAGAGALDEAGQLLRFLLKTDSSPSSINTMREHLKRAGHGELLDAYAPGSSR